MGLNRKNLGEIYRPISAKAVQTGYAWNPMAATPVGLNFQSAQNVDLSLPIEGFRFVFKFRDVIGTAAMTTPYPEGWLNLVSRIRISGTNTRQNGNVTLIDLDLPTLWVMQHLFQRKAASLNGFGATANQEYDDPSTPFTAMSAGATGTYDVRIVVDVPAYPFGIPNGQRPGFLIRQAEWSDSLQIQVNFATITNGATNVLGVDAATTTHTFTSYGSATGNPTMDIYSLPVIMGLTLKDQVVPGFCTRVSNPINTVLQSAGNNVVLANLQKQPTSRVFLKIGVATIPPAFSSLSDTNATALGILLGGNRNVREVDDVFAHKLSITRQYSTRAIQGYNVFDFIQSGNSDSSFPGDQVGPGTTLTLNGNVAGVANANGIVVQEQMLYRPEGALYSF